MPSTIWCPVCGTANREGSKFCNNCGARLEAEEGVRCPMCGHFNPPELEICSNCGARLKPLVAPSGEEETSEPIAESTSEPTGHEPELAEPIGEEKAQEEVAQSITAQQPPSEEYWIGEEEEPPPDLTPPEFAGPGEEVSPEPSPEELDFLPVEEVLPEEKEEIPAGMEEEMPAAEEVPAGVAEAVYPPPSGLLATAAAAGSEQAALFHKIVTQARPTPKALPRPTPARRTEWIIYLAVAVAIIVPLLSGGSLDTGTSISPGARSFYDALNALPAGSKVLIAHDYDPTVAAEMLPQARAILRHLGAQGAKVLSVSLTPQGPALAQQALQDTLAVEGYSYGVDYLNLGYVAGGEAGLRALARGSFFALSRDYLEGKGFAWYAISQGFSSLQNVDLIVVLAGSQDNLRLWVEQIQTPFQKRMVAGVSAQADPAARPYLRSRQIVGLLSGLVGAAEYERITGLPGRASLGVAAQSWGQAALVLLIILGNFAYFLGRKPR
ncbi:MAG: zinc ribbon domain-containing protein [Chloroflexi bacterium]|nr:zinc ribbon domain-containing protein [Chloroflexota bacterium]